MKSVKMACVHPAALQLFQKLLGLILDSGWDGRATARGTAVGGDGEVAELVQGCELTTLQDLERSGEGGVLAELCCETVGSAAGS